MLCRESTKVLLLKILQLANLNQALKCHVSATKYLFIKKYQSFSIGINWWGHVAKITKTFTKMVKSVLFYRKIAGEGAGGWGVGGQAK